MTKKPCCGLSNSNGNGGGSANRYIREQRASGGAAARGKQRKVTTYKRPKSW